MKKLIIALLAISLFSCGKDEVSFKSKPLATVDLKSASGVQQRVKSTSETISHLTALEVVKKTTVLQFNYNDPILNQGLVKFERGFDALQRDTVSSTPALKMWATDIIKEDGTLELAFIESKDCILLNLKSAPSGQYSDIIRDTIAYIPNSVLRSAETQIKALYVSKDYDAIYKLFNDAYTFTPISGAEYKLLKSQNLQ